MSKKKEGGSGGSRSLIRADSLEGGESQELWERRPGESLKAFHAFETYLRLGVSRTHADVAARIGRKPNSVSSLARKHGWLTRIAAWDAHSARLRLREAEAEISTMAKRQATTGGNMMVLASGALVRWDQHLRKEENEGKLLPLKEIAALVKIGSDLEMKARGILALEDPAVQAAFVRASFGRAGAAVENFLDGRAAEVAGAVSLEEAARARWVQTYIQPEGSFLPHRMQSSAIRSSARFAVLVAGIQSGKTAGGAIKFWNQIEEDRASLQAKGVQGFYWMIAPNAPIGEVMCEAFEDFAPDGELLKASGQTSNRLWTLRDGTRVQFRSGEHADKLVGRTVHGAWMDEFTILKEAVWTVSVRQRLATTNGWAIFTGTPRGQNWAYNEIWRRALKTDDSYDSEFEGFTWPSIENPRIDRKEVESARRQLPAAYFRREWEASWEAFHGQIYTGWGSKYEIEGLSDRPVPQGSVAYGGKDFGFSNPGCLLVGHLLPNGQWWIVDEVYANEKLPGWWVKEVAEVWRRRRVKKFWMDPAEPGQIGTMVDEGIPAEGAPNAVGEGIRHVAQLIEQGRILVDKDRCPNLCAQLRSYKWKEDSRGRKEEPEKENDHACLAPWTQINVEGLGWIEISKATSPGRVLTPDGYKDFAGSRLTRSGAEVIDVSFSDGFSLTLTPDHRLKDSAYRWASVGRAKVGSEWEVSSGPGRDLGDEARARRGALLEVGELLQSPLLPREGSGEEGSGEEVEGLPSRRRLGEGEWGEAQGEARPPRGPRHEQQRTLEPEAFGRDETPPRSHDAFEARRVASDNARGRSPRREEVAREQGWESLAPGARKAGRSQGGEEAQGRDGVPAMREGLHGEPVHGEPIEVLPPELQAGSAKGASEIVAQACQAEANGRAEVPILREAIRGEAVRRQEVEVLPQELQDARIHGSTSLVSLKPAGRMDVWCLAVEGHAFLLRNGLVSHNCDAARYLFLGYRDQRPPSKVSGYGSAKRKR